MTKQAAVGRRLRTSMAIQDQYLRPEGIYALNRALEVIQEELAYESGMGDDDLTIVPVVFEKTRRSFHFACVLDQGWGCREIGNVRNDDNKQNELWDGIAGVLETCVNNEEKFNKAKETILEGHNYHSAALQLENQIRSLKKEAESNRKRCAGYRQLVDHLLLNIMDKEDRRKFLTDLHLLYYGFNVHRLLYQSGILYRALMDHGQSPGILWFQGEVDERVKAPFPSYKGSFFDRNYCPISNQKTFHQHESIDQDGSKYTAVEDDSLRGTDLILKIAKVLYGDALDSRAEKGGVPRNGPILLVPVYDVWIGGEGFGGLWGCLVCTFKDTGARLRFLEATFPKFCRRCEKLGNELFEAGLAEIARTPLEAPYDLLPNFIRALAHVQDWERASVYRGKDREPLFCYARDRSDVKKDQSWVRCEELCTACRAAGNDGRKILSWKALKNFKIWRREIIPELTAEEIFSNEDVWVEFEYPKTTFVPDNSADNEIGDHFVWAVVRQQIEVLRLLVPMIRARRYAGRAAAAAIMARNMSHNIGSHPLAKLTRPEDVMKASKASEPDREEGEKVATFLDYIRSRMDYIASISTDVPRWAVAQDLKQLTEDFCSNKHLCEKLTELKDPCKIEFLGKSFPVQIPHGELGRQALFSIFENVLRNSERHGDDSAPRGQLKLKMSELNDDLIGVTLIDCGSRTCIGKRVKTVEGYLQDPFYEAQDPERLAELKLEYRGLKEMKISAAFLRMRAGHEAEGHAHTEADGTGNEVPPWIEPRAEPLGDKDYFAWRFALLRPKLAAIDELLKPTEIELLAACEEIGVRFVNIDALQAQLKRRVTFPHPFLVVSASNVEKITCMGLDLNRLPLRRIAVGGKKREVKKVWGWLPELDFQNCRILEKCLYEAWNERLWRNAGSDCAGPILVLAYENKEIAIKNGCLLGPDKSISENTLDLDGQNQPVVYEDHSDQRGGIYELACCFSDHNECRTHKKLWERAQAYLGCRKQTATYDMVKVAADDPVVREKLLEGGFVQILVLDERISQSLKKDGGENWIPRKLSAAGIFVFVFEDEERIKREEELSSRELINRVDKLRARLPASGSGLLIVLVHQAILNRVVGVDESACWLDCIERDLSQHLGAPVIAVVHSGRGRPAELSKQLEKRRFLEFSNLDTLVKDPGNKPILVDLLLAVRA